MVSKFGLANQLNYISWVLETSLNSSQLAFNLPLHLSPSRGFVSCEPRGPLLGPPVKTSQRFINFQININKCHRMKNIRSSSPFSTTVPQTLWLSLVLWPVYNVKIELRSAQSEWSKLSKAKIGTKFPLILTTEKLGCCECDDWLITAAGLMRKLHAWLTIPS